MIKYATLKDIAQVAKIEKKYIECAWTDASLHEAFKSGDYIFLVDFDDDILTGYLFFRTILDEAEICNMAVDESYRNRNKASELIAACMEHCIQQGIESIFLEVNEHNTNAVRLYSKHGFCVISRRKNYYQNSQTALIMKRVLSSY